jgi:hypothetical protein
MASGDHWYVLRVQSGMEAFVLTDLHNNNIPGFMVRTPPGSLSHCVEDGSVSPACLFARFPLQKQQLLMTIPGLVCIAGVPKPAPVPEKHIAQLQAAVDVGLGVTVLDSSLAQQSGKILDGPLRGNADGLIKLDGTWRLAIPIPALGRTLLVDLTGCSVAVNTPRQD